MVLGCLRETWDHAWGVCCVDIILTVQGAGVELKITVVCLGGYMEQVGETQQAGKAVECRLARIADICKSPFPVQPRENLCLCVSTPKYTSVHTCCTQIRGSSQHIRASASSIPPPPADTIPAEGPRSVGGR